MQTTKNALLESRGFAARRAGDEFVDPSNREDVATFLGLTRLPPEDIAYATHEQFREAYDEWKEGVEGTVYELNRPTSVIRAAMIVNMSTPRGAESFALFTRDLRVMEGKLTSIPAGVIPGHGGYVMNRHTSLSERAGLKPSDLISGKKSLAPSAVAGVLDDARGTAGEEAVDQMQGYLRALASGSGENYVIRGGAANASLHQKYLGEWAAPIALITQQFDPASQASELEDNMLDGKELTSCRIQYNTSVASALIDSVVTTGGHEIGISSKAHKGGGAAASLQGLQDTIKGRADEFPAGFWSEPKNERFRRIVSTITGKSAILGVLTLAEEEHLIPRADVGRIRDLILNPRDENQLTTVTRRLMAGYAANENHPNYNVGRHALASVARALCRRFNDEDFTSSAKAILNLSNVVQMNFVTGLRGEDLICRGFELIWPPNFAGTIKFYSDKAFSATEIKGRLGFKISKFRTSVEEPDESLQAPPLTQVELLKKKRKSERAVGKIVNPGERDVRDVDVPDEIALGRGLKT